MMHNIVHSAASGECSANLVFTSNHDKKERIRGIPSTETTCQNSESRFTEFFDAGIDSKTSGDEVIICMNLNNNR